VVKKAILPIFLVFLTACVTIAPPPPNLYLEGLPQSIITELTLEERIRAEEAWEYLRSGWIEKAQREFQRLGESSPVYDIGFGYLSLVQGDYDLAERFFDRVLQNRPRLLLAHLGLAQVYQKIGEEDRTFDKLREILDLDPQNAWAKNMFEQLKAEKTALATASAVEALAAGNRQKAKDDYLRALHYSPESSVIHAALAAIYKEENDLSNVLVHLKAAAESEPGNIRILEDYAATLAQSGELERTIEIYEKILQIDRGNKKAQEQIERLKNKLGLYELPSRYNEIPLSPAITREELAALLSVKLGDILGESGSPPPIIVDISASWASRFILKAASLGLLDVYPNHTFQPRRPLTRADLAEALFRTIKHLEAKGHRFIPQIPPDRIQISDVPEGHPSYEPIRRILSYQIMELLAGRAFRPELPVSGPEAIKTIDILLALSR